MLATNMEIEAAVMETPPPSGRVSRPRSVMSNSSTSTIKSQPAQKKTNKTPVRKAPASKKKKQKKKPKQEDYDSDDDGEPIPAEEFVVEQILDKEIVEGEARYFVKWKNWSSDDNTWEPVTNLTNCPVLIAQFEEKLAKKSVAKKRPRPAAGFGSGGRQDDKDDAAGIFDEFDEDMDMDLPILTSYPENKELVNIIQVAVVDGTLTFLVQWKDAEDTKPPSNGHGKPITGELAMIKADCLNKLRPQQVINFYEKNIWYLTDQDSEVHAAAKAGRALLESRERRYITTKKRQRYEELQQQRLDELCEDEDLEPKEELALEDPAAQAIEAEKNGYGKFDVDESGLSSSSSGSEGSDNNSDD